MRFYRSLRSLQNDGKKGLFSNRQNLLQTFYCDKREFTGVIVVSGVSPSVSFADSSLVRGSLELPPSDEGGGAAEKHCLSVASEGEITVNNHLPHKKRTTYRALERR